MNGIDAVAIACGQDWRALEASAHAWASWRRDSYGSLTRYWIDEESSLFCGELELPICTGTRGGIIGTNPVCKYALALLGNPSSSELASVRVLLH